MLSLFTAFWYNRKIRMFIVQALLLVLLVALGTKIWNNLQINLQNQGIATGFAFLDDTAGFDIIMHLISYNEQSSYARAFCVGLLNTLLVSALGILIATVLGFLLGMARASMHWFVAKIAEYFVELIRNIPLLLQLFFWYFAVLRALPLPKQSYSLGHVYLNIRGLTFPAPHFSSHTDIYLYGMLGIFSFMLILFKLNRRHVRLMGQSYSLYFSATVLSLIGMIGLIVTALYSVSWQMPVLRGFNFQDGITLIPEFIALLLALSIYTAAFIAEIVRMGIESVSKGQIEAALSLGLTHWQALKLVVVPQALKVILPPLTNQYLNLTKNSSLAAAIAYPDLISVFAGTVLNQTGQAVEIITITMGVYLFISLTISLCMMIYERSTQWGSR